MKFDDNLKQRKLYNPDGTYSIKEIFLKPNLHGWQSTLQEYDKQGRCVQSKFYLDTNFKKLDTVNINVYNEDGTHLATSSSSRCYSKSLWNKEDLLLWKKVYEDKDFSNLEFSELYTYNENNTIKLVSKDYIEGIFVEILLDFNKMKSNNSPDELFILAPRNCKNMVTRKYYYDAELKKLKETNNFVHNEDGSYVEFVQYTYPSAGKIYSQKNTVDISGTLMLKQEFFYDDKFERLLALTNIIHNHDGSFQRLSIYEEPQPYGAFSIKEYVNSLDKITRSESYANKSFEGLIQTIDYTYNRNGIYQRNINFYIENPYPFAIEKYNSKGQVLSAIAYLDREGKNILRKSIFTNNDDGSIKAERYYPNSKENWDLEIQEFAPDKTLQSSKRIKCNFMKKLQILNI